MDPNKVDKASGKMSGDGDIASVMGFSGFGKKARTFDLDAIFEQTRRTAIERSQHVLEERQKESEMEEEGESSWSIKKSVQTERDKAATSRKQKGVHISDSDGDSESSNSEIIGPLPAPQQDDDDDKLVGPPLPPGYAGNAAHSDEEEEEEDDDDDDDNPVKKIPDTHEITLQHGTKTENLGGAKSGPMILV